MIGLVKHTIAKIGGLPVISNYAWHLVKKSPWLYSNGEYICEKVSLLLPIPSFGNFVKCFPIKPN